MYMTMEAVTGEQCSENFLTEEAISSPTTNPITLSGESISLSVTKESSVGMQVADYNDYMNRLVLTSKNYKLYNEFDINTCLPQPPDVIKEPTILELYEGDVSIISNVFSTFLTSFEYKKGIITDDNFSQFYSIVPSTGDIILEVPSGESLIGYNHFSIGAKILNTQLDELSTVPYLP